MASKKRSLLKAVTWRLAGSMTTISVVWIYTSNVQLSVCAATIDLFVKILAYYVHERVWDKIDFGKMETLNAVIKEARRLKSIEEHYGSPKGEDQNGQ